VNVLDGCAIGKGDVHRGEGPSVLGAFGDGFGESFADSSFDGEPPLNFGAVSVPVLLAAGLSVVEVNGLFKSVDYTRIALRRFESDLK
jgi:hypothetical protein